MVIATGVNVVLAEWIIDGTRVLFCFKFALSATFKEWVNHLKFEFPAIM